jgi:hypothetical protein
MRLNAIPLNKLFDVLDECLNHYQTLLQEYGGSPQRENETLANWFAENWWLPTFMVSMAAATLVRWLRARQPRGQAGAKRYGWELVAKDGGETRIE